MKIPPNKIVLIVYFSGKSQGCSQLALHDSASTKSEALESASSFSVFHRQSQVYALQSLIFASRHNSTEKSNFATWRDIENTMKNINIRATYLSSGLWAERLRIVLEDLEHLQPTLWVKTNELDLRVCSGVGR